MIYWVETGLWGELDRFRSALPVHFRRDQRVICRSERGLEVGRVITEDTDDPHDEDTSESHDAEAFCNSDNSGSGYSDHGSHQTRPPVAGTLLRSVSEDDELIIERLARYKERAFAACQRFLRENNVTTPLVDVEHLFDGQTIYFYFLGQVPPELEQLNDRLAELYDAKVRFRQFAERLASGCGPGCGTTASRCSASGCSSCGLAGGCGQSGKDVNHVPSGTGGSSS